MQESIDTGQIRGFTAAVNNEVIIDEAYYDALHQDEYNIQNEMDDSIAFLVSTQHHQGDKDTMYYHQAMR